MTDRDKIAFAAFSYAEKIIGEDSQKNPKRVLEIGNAFVAGMEHGVNLMLRADKIIEKEVNKEKVIRPKGAFQTFLEEDGYIKAGSILMFHGFDFTVTHHPDEKCNVIEIANTEGVLNQAIGVLQSMTRLEIMYQDGTTRRVEDAKTLNQIFPHYNPAS